ncbi:hypothetical protein AHAS_Ahas05G0062400 [Arachis hypogaea]
MEICQEKNGGDDDYNNEIDVKEVTNVLTRQHSLRESSFMRALDLAVLNASKDNFLNLPTIADGKFIIAMYFNSKEIVIAAIKNYTTCRGVNYRDHCKLDSSTIVEAIKSLVEADPSL